jgi:hypothetical protein
MQQLRPVSASSAESRISSSPDSVQAGGASGFVFDNQNGGYVQYPRFSCFSRNHQMVLSASGVCSLTAGKKITKHALDPSDHPAALDIFDADQP